MSERERLYRFLEERNPMQLDEDGDYYIQHVEAMTAEGLHAKSDIAAELGWRDREIDRAEQREAELKAEADQLRIASATQAREAEQEKRVVVRLLKRYRYETPLGHQPHMIAGEVDALLAKHEAGSG